MKQHHRGIRFQILAVSSLASPEYRGGGLRSKTVGLSLRLKISLYKVPIFRGFYPDGETKRLPVILSGVELLRAARAASGTRY